MYPSRETANMHIISVEGDLVQGIDYQIVKRARGEKGRRCLVMTGNHYHH